jgi:DNA-binding IclR family transcriptional regulator
VRTTEAADRVALALEILADASGELPVSEVARRLGVHKSTASRLLATLAARGLVERTSTGGYRLGVGLLRFAGVALTGLDTVSQARPELEALSARTRETVNLAVLDGADVVYVDQVTGSHAVVTANWVGLRRPAHASSSGKVLMAFGDEALVERILSRRLERLTARTIIDPTVLRSVLADVRRRGFAATVGELEDQLSTVAAPVWSEGKVIAAVSISGPAYRLPPRDHARLGRLVVEAGQAISKRMGRRPIGVALP